jgi:chaperonin GroES
MEFFIKNLIIIGDRVLIKPKNKIEKTKSGLYLPVGIQEKEKIQSGYIVKIGPGYAIAPDIDESWKSTEYKIKYIPLQVKEGDLAIFLLYQSYEVFYKNEKYFIVPQTAILMIEREKK